MTIVIFIIKILGGPKIIERSLGRLGPLRPHKGIIE